MKRNIYKMFILFLLLILLTTGCSQKPLYTEESFYLHTHVQVSTFGQLKDKDYQEIWQALDQIDQTLSTTLPTSEVAAINGAAGDSAIKVSQATFDLIQSALTYSKMDPAFDITIEPIVKLWGIGSDEARVPDQAELDEQLPLVGYDQVVLNQDDLSVYLPQKGMGIDLGAIAKGYAADLTKDILLKKGIDQAIINYGGNILALGTKAKDTPWRIGVQNPDKSRGLYLGILNLTDQAIVTSGTYERFFQSGDQVYHHILSPSTGYPINNDLWAVSIITPSAQDADALSTLIFAQGLTQGYETVMALKNTEAIFITHDKKVVVTTGLAPDFTLTDDQFEMVAP